MVILEEFNTHPPFTESIGRLFMHCKDAYTHDMGIKFCAIAHLNYQYGVYGVGSSSSLAQNSSLTLKPLARKKSCHLVKLAHL